MCPQEQESRCRAQKPGLYIWGFRGHRPYFLLRSSILGSLERCFPFVASRSSLDDKRVNRALIGLLEVFPDLTIHEASGFHDVKDGGNLGGQPAHLAFAGRTWNSARWSRDLLRARQRVLSLRFSSRSRRALLRPPGLHWALSLLPSSLHFPELETKLRPMRETSPLVPGQFAPSCWVCLWALL